jgi:HEAT repeat protein
MEEEAEDRDRAVTAAGLIAAARLGGGPGLARARALAEGLLRESWLLRATLARAAAVAGSRDLAPELVRWLRSDPDPRVAQAAASALAVLGETASLLEALEAEEPFRRRAAVAGLAEVRSGEVLEPLLRCAQDEDPGVRLEAGAALLDRGWSEAFPVLVSLLEADASVWLGALEVLELRSGMAFGRDPARWTAWFASVRDRLVFRPDPPRYEIRP